MSIDPKLFRTDVRGIYPTEVNAETHEAIGRAFAAVIKPKKVAVGMDVRFSGPELKQALIKGLLLAGVDVIDVGLVSTDMIYFASGHYQIDAGLTVTASHNPAEYNGLKFSLKGGVPLTGDNGLNEIRDLAVANHFVDAKKSGRLTHQEIFNDYLEKCLSFVDRRQLKPLKIVLNPNFGAVSLIYPRLLSKVPFEPIVLNGQPDGSFPKGRPDPLRPETRPETIKLIKRTKPSFGAAWDADGDRVFFYDENGHFVDAYYLVSLLADYFLRLYPGSSIVFDARQQWASIDTITSAGGKPEMEKTGNVFIRSRMRQVNAPYGGEMSAHHYFRDFYYCDNGLIPFLIVWQLVSEGKSLSKLVTSLEQHYPVSGEINFTVKDVGHTLTSLEKRYANEHPSHFDGLSLEHGREWRANIRPSNNEPLLRLNVEAKTEKLVQQKTKELSSAIRTVAVYD